MFVPVTCSQCGQPFQVPGDTLGKTAACPWCQATVLALPIASPAPVSESPVSTSPAPSEPLSLDDAPPAIATPEPLPLQAPRKRRQIALMVILAVATALLTLVVVRYHKGYLLSLEWHAFTAPDGSCTIDLPGRPTEEEADSARGDALFLSTGWYSGTRAWIGWQSLTPAQVQEAAAKDGWVSLRKSLVDPEVERLKQKFSASLVREATVGMNPETIEVRLESPGGPLIERLIVQTAGSHPRLYLLGISGRGIHADGSEARRFFESFRIRD